MKRFKWDVNYDDEAARLRGQRSAARRTSCVEMQRFSSHQGQRTEPAKIEKPNCNETRSLGKWPQCVLASF